MTEAKTTTTTQQQEQAAPGTTARTLLTPEPLTGEQHLAKQRELAEKYLKRDQAQPPEHLGDPPGNLYYWYERPDGEKTIAPATSVETYRARDFKITGYELIDDMPSFLKGQYEKNSPKDAHGNVIQHTDPATQTSPPARPPEPAKA